MTTLRQALPDLEYLVREFRTGPIECEKAGPEGTCEDLGLVDDACEMCISMQTVESLIAAAHTEHRETD